MVKKIYFFSIFLLCSICIFSSIKVTKARLYENVELFGKEAGYNIGLSQNKNYPVNIIAQIIKLFLTILGMVFFGLMLYSGYLWMTAQGNSDQVDDAKTKMTDAVIGLIIIFAAYAFTYLILEKVIGIVQGWF